MSEAAHGAHPAGLAHQFETVEQQREAGTLGMWLFLMTEILFFGGMFTAYTVYRELHFEAFVKGSRLLDYRFGAINTAVLICSSLTMVLAIHAAQTAKKKSTIIFWLITTMILGATFIGVKLRFEWYRDYKEAIIPGIHFVNHADWGALAPHIQIFMCFYFFMTGLHALHMVIGLGILTVLVWMTAHDKFSPEYYAPLDISGLYWHFVDIVWIF